MISKLIGGGAIAIILALGIYFNLPHANVVTAGVTADLKTVPPDLQSISGFINTKPIYHLSSLKGWVILVHFWRFSCGECQADQSFINYLWTKYHSYGLMILGVHTPQYDNEKDYSQVLQAVQSQGIKYPILLDNTKQTWNAYGDAFWPRDALIGKSGYERFAHIGTGDQQEIETNIRFLLTERNVPLS